MDWTQGGGKLKVEYAGGSVSAKAQAEGIVLQSLDFGTKFGQGLDPEDRVREPFQAMGYTMYKDYDAPAVKTKTDYIKGKQIWYSMSHGGTENGTPYSAFEGLAFKDGAIRASDLQPLNLNYRLVIADGCCSAQTWLGKSEAAEYSNLLSGCKEFAESFGANTAYIGWSWEMGPNEAQKFSAKFVSNLKGGKTVEEAFNKFHDDNDIALPDARFMKLHGRRDMVMDKPNEPFRSNN